MTSVLFLYLPTLEPHHRRPQHFSDCLCTLMKLCCLSLITSLFSICLSTVLQIVCSMILPVTDETDWAVVSQVFWTFLLNIGFVPLFQSLKASPDSHNFSNMMDTGLATSSDMDESHQVPWTCVPSDSLVSLKPSRSFLSPSLPLSSAALAVWLDHLLRNTE